MQTVMFNGKEYECRRYTYNELKKLFEGYLVVLKDAVIKNLNVQSGVLVGVYEGSRKNELMKEALDNGWKYRFLDLRDAPILGFWIFELMKGGV